MGFTPHGVPMLKRGFFGVGIYQPKFTQNLGSIMRCAQIYGSSFNFTIGKHYRHTASDTLKSVRNVPMFYFENLAELKKNGPKNAKIIGVELAETAVPLGGFRFPDQSILLLGSEDTGLPPEIQKECDYILKLPGNFSMNVACAASIVINKLWEQYNCCM